MPTYAENLIGSVTVGSGGTSSIDFTSIPQTYTDLKIVISSRDSRSSNGPGYLNLSINGSTSNFSYKSLYGYASGPGDPNPSGTPVVGSDSGSANYISYAGGINTQTANSFGNNEIYIPNYTSSNYKSISVDGVNETNANYPYFNHLLNSLWSNTAAITSISITPGGSPFLQYTTAYLYGITSYTGDSTPKAVGGVVTSDSTYYYHTFTNTGNFTPTQNLTNVDYLVVAGGGGGGSAPGYNGGAAGGGGAGGLRATFGTTGGGGSLETKLSLNASTQYTVTVGAGGPSIVNVRYNNIGSNSAISGSGLTTITATGGGRGGAVSGVVGVGGDGGSGGGGGNGASPFTGGTGTTNQGYAGGSSSGNANVGGGGGGGAGAAGSNYSSGNGGAGGAGVNFSSFSISGVTYLAGGGGGGSYASYTASGGSGVGGSGGAATGNGSAGTANTGSGGGGSGTSTSSYSGAGGSGIVIIRYAK